MRKKTKLACILMVCGITLNLRNAHAQTCSHSFKVVVLGSSTSAGYKVDPDSAYVNLFRNYLITEVNTNCTVVNLAVSGYNTYKMQPSWFTPPAGQTIDYSKNIDAAIALNPNAVLINFPSNDARDNIPLEDQKNNFLRVKSKIDSMNIPVWVTSTQPRNLTLAQRNMLIEMRDWLATVFGTRFIDFWTDLANADGTLKAEYDVGDGTHLTGEGHAILFDRVVNSSLVPEVCAIVLPVELTAFKAEAVGRDVQLSWNATGLEEGAFFAVEYSDGMNGNWHTLSNIKAVGTVGSEIGQFSFNHMNATAFASELYYRIRIVNKDRTHKYSETKTVKFLQKVQLSASAGSGKLMLVSKAKVPVQFIVYDLNGKLVARGEFQNRHTVSIWKKGIYVVKMVNSVGDILIQKIAL